jgi:homoserine kinase
VIVPSEPSVELRHHSVQVPATSANLGAGFDAFGLAVDHHLAVRTVDRSSQAERVRTLDDASGELAAGDDNLVWRSFETFCRRHEVDVPDVGLVARSVIPLERGMGSSSAAIVAGLALARAVTGLPVGDRELLALATDLEGHPDNVAPALLGGLVACARADDGSLVIRRVNPAANLRPVLLVPDARQATSAARAVLPEQLDRAAVIDQAARAGQTLAALTGAWPLSAAAVGDRLHEPARLAVMVPTAEVLTAVRSAGIAAWLSGAGPSVAAVIEDLDVRALARLEAIGVEHGFTCRPARFDLSGARTCPDDGCGLGGGDCAQCPRERL